MGMVQRYQKRISGPLMDRIDIHLDIQRVSYQKLAGLEGGETLAVIRRRVEIARTIQATHFADVSKANLLINADMGPVEVQQFCQLDGAGKHLMRAAMQQMNLSVRAYHWVLKHSRTLADLAGEESIRPNHLAEALQYRPRELA
jgi:magnesium chelatase family protein